jgi:excisionase family DNA binding protein
MKRKDGAKTPPHTGAVKVMTVRDLSAYLHLHRSTIYRLLRQNQIPAFRVGSDWRFNIEASVSICRGISCRAIQPSAN